MDPLVAVGLATAVVTFLDFGFKVIKRLEKLQKTGDLPEEFREIRTRLPLITEIISATHGSYQTLPDSSQQRLDQIVRDCFNLVGRIEGILDNVTVADGDSKLRRFSKAVISLRQGRQVESISNRLTENVQLLMALNILQADKKSKLSNAEQATGEPPSYIKAVGIFLVPFERDHNFIGRQAILEDVGNLLIKHQRVSISGMGGVGKSQVAIEMAYRLRDRDPDAHVFWVYGGSVTRFYEGYKRIAQELDLPEWNDPDVSILELVHTWFQKTEDRFFLVLDNADDINYYWPNKYGSPSTVDSNQNLSKFLPVLQRRNGKLLITSRDSRIARKLATTSAVVALEPMSQVESRELFLSHIEEAVREENNQALDTLVYELGFVPLAITQAALFINENFITTSNYVLALKDDEAEVFLHEELYDSRRDEESVDAIFRAWKISYDFICSQNSKAADLLSLFAVLDRQSIPKWLVPESLMTVTEAVTCIGLLNSFHLISLRSDLKCVQLHRMVQRFVQCTLKKAGALEKWQEIALACVTEAYPTVIGESEYPICDALVPHVQVLTEYTYKSEQALVHLGVLLCWSADYDVERGMWTQALNRAKRSYELLKNNVAPNDQRLASAMWSFGRITCYEAKSDSEMDYAASMIREGFSISDPSSWNFAETAFELAHIYYTQNKERECLEMGKASFECWKRMEGEHSQHTLDNMHDYSLELAMFGHIEEAIANWRAVLNLCPKSDARENTRNIFRWRSLAGIAEFQDDAAMAELLYKKLVDLTSVLYSAQNVHVFDYRLSHAEQVLRQGRADEAIDLSRHMLKACENKSEWRILLSCHETMAEGFKLKGEFDFELEHRIQCLQIIKKYLGESHKESISSANATARCLLENLKAEEAEPLLKRVLRWSELNSDSPLDLADTFELLGVCKNWQNLDKDAEAMFTRAMDLNQDDHERHLFSLDNLCTSLGNQQKWSSLETRCRELSSVDSIYKTKAHWILITALENQGKIEDALQLRAQSLELEDQSCDSLELRRQAKLPPSRKGIDRRFGRIIHPRTWSCHY